MPYKFPIHKFETINEKYFALIQIISIEKS